MKKFAYNLPYEGNIDKECIQICNYLNSLPGISTTESCCGHGKYNFNIWMEVTDWRGISFLGRCLDRRYGGHEDDILVRVSNSDVNENHAVLHLYTPNHKGEEAYALINDLCENMVSHLNNEAYIKAFMDNCNGFNIKEI